MNKNLTRKLPALLGILVMMISLFPSGIANAAPPVVFINEIQVSTSGDDREFFELQGAPGADLSELTLVGVKSDNGTSAGTIDRVISLAGESIPADGFWLGISPAGATAYGVSGDLSIADNSFENGTATYFLVSAFTGSEGNDLDTNDDGVLDSTPWDIVVDSINIRDSGASDFSYGATSVGPDGLFLPSGTYRCPDAPAGSFSNFHNFSSPDGTPGVANGCGGGGPGPLPFKIHEVQGSGLISPKDGDTVIIEGIVVGDFQDTVGSNGDLNGFFVQEEDVDADADPATSEGIFVFDGSSLPDEDVAIGDLVSVEGEVSEFGGLTEITSLSGVTVQSSGNALPTATSLSLPVAGVDAFEAYEGMLVTFPQALVISEYFNFDRFNEIVLTSERHLTPTAEFEPGPAAIQAAQDFLLDKITLDDGRTSQNPDPAIHPNGGDFDLSNLFRGGDTVTDLTGVMHYAFGLYRIQPTQGANHNNTNPRTGSPEPVGGDLKVASFNVLNYFTTLDDAGSICGPLADQDCRGADNATEFTRQRDKIIAALAEIDADVVGLLEIENYPGDVPTADLVSGLNDVVGAGIYDYIATGGVGSDAIRVAVIYKPASVSPLGAFAVLDSSVDARFNDGKNRPTLAQTFRENSTGAVFTIAVNHLKSKGSDCDDVGDPDLGDGAGNCNLTRKTAADAMVDWLASDPTGSGDEDFLIIGDLNSYDKEDPIVVLVAGGYTDLSYAFHGEGAYSYVFDGQIGYLDYALASADLLDEVTGVAEWHINADEPDMIDYDTSFKKDAQDAIYAPDAYRSSDHDPVVVGLDLEIKARLGKAYVLETLIALRTTATDPKDQKNLDKAIEHLTRSLDPTLWVDDDHLESKHGKKVFDEEKQSVKELMKIIRDGSPLAGDAQAAIDNFLLADSALAQTAMEAAQTACDTETDPKKQDKCEKEIDKAQKEFDKAADEIANGKFDKAIDKYKKAWEHAIK